MFIALKQCLPSYATQKVPKDITRHAIRVCCAGNRVWEIFILDFSREFTTHVRFLEIPRGSTTEKFV